MAAPLGGSVSILSHQSVFPMEGSNIYFSRFDSISNSSQNYLSLARSKASHARAMRCGRRVRPQLPRVLLMKEPEPPSRPRQQTSTYT